MMIHKMSGAVQVQVLLALLLLVGCGSDSMKTHSDEAQALADNREEKTVWIEEIRGGDGTRVVGYLEKKQLVKDGVSGHRHGYFVYDADLHEIYEGMILDNGKSYLHTKNGDLEQIGITGITKGVRRILNTDGNVTFFRNGRQIFHETE